MLWGRGPKGPFPYTIMARPKITLHPAAKRASNHYPDSLNVNPGKDWMQDALCLGSEMFFPVDNQATLAAQNVCYVCPVLETCLEYAFANYEPFGIWGGCQPGQRRSIFKKWRTAGYKADGIKELNKSTFR